MKRIYLVLLAIVLVISCGPQGWAHSSEGESHLVKVSNAMVEYFSIGNDETIILIPGGGLNATYLEGLAQVLSKEGYRAVRINPRGAGASKGETENITLQDLASDVAGVIKDLNVGPVHVTGHAFGNRVARMFAADHPQLIKSVILLAAGGKIAPTSIIKLLIPFKISF